MNTVALKDRPSTEVAPPSESASLMEVISRAASDPATDVTKLERLMDLYERVERRQAEQAFNEAMNAAQREIVPVVANEKNKQTNSKYASYPALDRAIRPVYTKHGFALSFDTGEGAAADYVRVLCYVSHQEGFSRTYKTDMPADGKGAKGGDVMTKTHAAGSAMSYGQRYLLKLIFNIAVSEDDDGNAAGGNGPVTAEQSEQIRTLMEKVKADPELFCKFMKVESIPEIPARRFRDAIEALNSHGETTRKRANGN